MNHSDTLDELANALSTAQGDPHAEAIAIRPVLRRWRKINYSKGRTPTQRFMASVGFGSTDCWYWLGYLDALGYGRSAVVEGESKAHRAAYRIFKGEISTGLEVMHSCDARSCVNPEHLSLGTHTENVADMVRKARQRTGDVAGEKNGMAKLTREKVAKIRELKAQGVKQVDIAHFFGVSPMAVSRVARGQSWL